MKMMNVYEQVQMRMYRCTHTQEDVLLNYRVTNCLAFSTESPVPGNTPSQAKRDGWSPYSCQIETAWDSATVCNESSCF